MMEKRNETICNRTCTKVNNKDKLDVKAFKAALRISKIKTGFHGSDTELDNILEALNRN